MTSDAKIGLLLGLVFIFVIAFIINGLPNFGSRPQSADAAPAATFDSQNIGDLAGETGNASDLLDYQELMGQDASEERLTTEMSALDTLEPQSSMPSIDGTDENVGYRTILALDDIGPRFSEAWKNATRELAELGNEAVRMQNPAEERVPAPDMPSDDEMVETTHRTNTERVLVPQSERTDRAVTVTEKSTVRSILNRTYVVKEGDVLATVAKNVYGSEEGNRLVNIDRIYKANSMVLNSPDEIFVGQTLIIPPLPDAPQQTGAETPNPTLSESLFEKVEAIGRRNLPDASTAPKPGERWYTVQEGDSLWKIAAKQLGSGARCDEVAKMNVDTLKNKDTLSIGMKLRLPLK